MNTEKIASVPNAEIDKKMLDSIKNIIESCNINFLIGSGLSAPFFGTLGKIEVWLSDLEKEKEVPPEVKYYVRGCLYKRYFDVAMKKNNDIYDYDDSVNDYIDNPKLSKDKLHNTYKSYKNFLSIINHILYLRGRNTLSKQVNVFTTNIDIFVEKVIEDLNLNFNDGFNGIFTKRFSLSNFKRSFFQKSLHYDNISEMPVFNLLKMHGSLTWELSNKVIIFDYLFGLDNVIEEEKKCEFINIVELSKKLKIEEAKLDIKQIINEAKGMDSIPDIKNFVRAYEKLQIINPTKEKFKETTLNQTYYELLRLYANELEKENSVLFVMGFSFADEHIREITIRAVKSNPTLKLYIFSFWKNAEDIKNNFNDSDINIEDFYNIELVTPFDKFDLRNINECIFRMVLDNIKKNSWE